MYNSFAEELLAIQGHKKEAIIQDIKAAWQGLKGIKNLGLKNTAQLAKVDAAKSALKAHRTAQLNSQGISDFVGLNNFPANIPYWGGTAWGATPGSTTLATAAGFIPKVLPEKALRGIDSAITRGEQAFLRTPVGRAGKAGLLTVGRGSNAVIGGMHNAANKAVQGTTNLMGQAQRGVQSLGKGRPILPTVSANATLSPVRQGI